MVEIGPQVVEQLRQMWRTYQHLTPGIAPSLVESAAVPERRKCILREDLDASNSVLGDPSYALADLLVRGSDGRLHREKTAGGGTRTVTVFNEFSSIDFAAGTYLKIERVDGIWEPYAADCEPFSETSDSSI